MTLDEMAEESVQHEKQRDLGWDLRNPNISEVCRGRDGREEAVGAGGSWASSQEERADLLEEGRNDYPSGDCSEGEAGLGKGWRLPA